MKKRFEANVVLNGYIREDIATGWVEIEFTDPGPRLMGDKTGRIHVSMEIDHDPRPLKPGKVYRLTIEEVD